MTWLRENEQTDNTDIRTRVCEVCERKGGGARERRVSTVSCKEKATGLRLRVKAEVTQTRDDPSDVGEITHVF